MENLWILTEEKPKSSVIRQIVEMYCSDFNSTAKFSDNIQIKPIVNNFVFDFKYEVLGININNIEKIIIKTVSGSSSFLDFLVYKQEKEPFNTQKENPIMAIEETKTSDSESRNTGVYQRGTKFVYIDYYYKNVNKYMLYNDELEDDDNRPSDTSIFGTNMLLTLGIKIIGKDTSKWFKRFNSIEELIEFKSTMRRPPPNNIPIDITFIDNNTIEISGRLSKPIGACNIGHDPNIGALSLISKTLRTLGWNKNIVITRHGVSQEFINRVRGRNKFLFVCKILNLKLKGITIPYEINLPDSYWHYENSSEKMASILLHITCEFHNYKEVYQNHAGCERGYFKTLSGKLIALPKRDENNVILYIPDLILYNDIDNEILLIEGKKLDTLSIGLKEIKNYDSIENEFIKKYYPNTTITRWISIYRW